MEREQRLFSEAFEGALEQFASLRGPEAKRQRDPERLREAVDLNPIAEAFASSEVFSLKDPPLGVFGTAKLVPPVGDQLRRKLRNTDAYQQYTALYGVLRALAVGYVGFLSAEHELTTGTLRRPPKDIWNFVVHNFRGDVFARFNVAHELAEAIHGLAGVALLEEMREARVVGRRAKRVPLAARYYANAGFLMRAARHNFVFRTLGQRNKGLGFGRPPRGPQVAK